ncbi:hypothetical protein IFR05_002406 [Cadophora sp. M221]|nr:hypothetical protein IFR05_002406 [Cadophora sp. M221]
MAPRRPAKGGKKTNTRGKKKRTEEENGVESLGSAPVVADGPSSLIPMVATAAGEDNVVDASGSGPEASGEQPFTSSLSVPHPMTFTGKTPEQAVAGQKRTRKEKTGSQDKVVKKKQYKAPAKIQPGHPLFDEYQRIPLNGTGEDLTPRQRAILAIGMDPKAAYLRASRLYSRKTGLILSRFAPTRPDAKKNDEFSDDKITDALLEELGMTRDNLRYASGGKKPQGDEQKLVNYDVGRTEAPMEETNEDSVMRDADTTEDEAGDGGSAEKIDEELNEQYLDIQMAEIAAQEGSSGNQKEKMGKGNGTGKKLTQPGSAISTPLENGLSEPIDIIWDPTMDADAFRAYIDSHPAEIPDMDDREAEHQGSATIKWAGLTFWKFALCVLGSVREMGVFSNFAKANRLFPKRIQLQYQEMDSHRKESFWVQEQDGSFEKAGDIMQRLPARHYRVVVGLEMVGLIAATILEQVE